MKTTLYISIILATVICTTSCRKEPIACFQHSPSYGDIYTHDVVQFDNCSRDAIAYQWNFGDGNTSREQDPVHSYDSSGIYEVTLTVYSKGDMKSSVHSDNITIEKTFKEKLLGNWNWSRKVVRTYSNNFLVSDNSSTVNGFINFINDSTVVIYDSGVPSTDTVAWWGNDDITIAIDSWESWDVQFTDTMGNNSDDFLILIENGFTGMQDGTPERWYCNK